jgi:hypothetical protein
LPLDQVITIETKGYREGSWRRFEREGVQGYLGVPIGGRVSAVAATRYPDGLDGHQVMPPFAIEEEAA